MIGWAVTITMLFSDINRLSASSDPLIRFFQIVGAIVFIGGTGVLLWHLWVVWTGRRRWTSRVWSVVLALSALVVLWVALAFKLISFGVNY